MIKQQLTMALSGQFRVGHARQRPGWHQDPVCRCAGSCFIGLGRLSSGVHKPEIDCYDVACAESLFHSLKVEAIHGERFSTRKIMPQTVFEYTEVDYNGIRRNSVNGFISPEALEAYKAA
jgi:hypothetical protein